MMICLATPSPAKPHRALPNHVYDHKYIMSCLVLLCSVFTVIMLRWNMITQPYLLVNEESVKTYDVGDRLFWSVYDSLIPELCQHLQHVYANLLRIVVQTGADDAEAIRCQYPAMQLVSLVIPCSISASWEPPIITYNWNLPNVFLCSSIITYNNFCITTASLNIPFT